MAEIDTHRLIWIVTGVQLTAEIGDRPLAYRIESEARQWLGKLLPATPEGELPNLVPVVISDVYYLNHDAIQKRPLISIGGPGVNALSASLADELPAAVAVDDTLIIQMDVEMNDLRCAVWGMDHLETVRAVELFLSKGYLETFLRGVIKQLEIEG